MKTGVGSCGLVLIRVRGRGEQVPTPPEAELLVSDRGYIVDSGIGLSFCPASLWSLAGRYDNPTPELTISPSQWLRLWLEIQPCLQRPNPKKTWCMGPSAGDTHLMSKNLRKRSHMMNNEQWIAPLLYEYIFYALIPYRMLTLMCPYMTPRCDTGGGGEGGCWIVNLPTSGLIFFLLNFPKRLRRFYCLAERFRKVR